MNPVHCEEDFLEMSRQTRDHIQSIPELWYHRLANLSPGELADWVAALRTAHSNLRDKPQLSSDLVKIAVYTSRTLTALREWYREPTLPCRACKGEQEIESQGSNPGYGGTTVYWINLACGHGEMEESDYTGM
jgi:hypothetical protein